MKVIPVTYLMKVIPEKRRVHYIWYLRFYSHYMYFIMYYWYTSIRLTWSTLLQVDVIMLLPTTQSTLNHRWHHLILDIIFGYFLIPKALEIIWFPIFGLGTWWYLVILATLN
jgi:hypothetical protein